MSFINQWRFETGAYSQCEVGKTVLNTFCNMSPCQPQQKPVPQPIRINQGYEVTQSAHWVDCAVDRGPLGVHHQGVKSADAPPLASLVGQEHIIAKSEISTLCQMLETQGWLLMAKVEVASLRSYCVTLKIGQNRWKWVKSRTCKWSEN